MKLLIALLILLPCVAFGQNAGYNCTIFTQTDFGATTVSTKILNKNSERRCLTFQNKGQTIVFVKLDSAHVALEGVQVGGTTLWEPIHIFTNPIFIKTNSGSATITVLEGK